MKVSVITVSKQSGQTLPQTLCSVLSQSYPDIELIVVDAGSSDGSKEILHSFDPLFKGRLKWISEKDEGMYEAINKGLAMASGDVIGFLNSDDFFTSPKVIERMVASFPPDADAVCGDVHYVSPKRPDVNIRPYSSSQFKRRKMLMGYQPAHPSFYCRKEVYKRFGNYDESFKISGDFEFLLRTIYKGRIKLTYIPIDFVTMRTGGLSSSSLSNHLTIYREHLRAYCKHRLFIGLFLDHFRYFLKALPILKYRLLPPKKANGENQRV